MNILEILSQYKDRVNTLNEILEYPEFNVDYRFSKRYLDEINSLNKVVELYDKYLETKNDSYLQKIKTLLVSKAYDEYQGITITLSLKCDLLLNLYKEYFEKSRLDVSVDGLTITIKGVNLYALYKEESGIHEIIDKNSKQDVFIEVLPIISTDLKLDMNDVKVDYFHSSGAGGQNINKVETAIRMTHIPTNIVVTCQDERSQLQNKTKASQMLGEKVNKYYSDLADKEIKKIKKGIKKEIIRKYNLTNNKVEDLRLKKTFDLNDLKQVLLQDIASEILLNGWY